MMQNNNAITRPYASPWKRFGAVLIDSVLLLIAGALLGVLIGNVASLDTLTDPRFESRMNGYGYLLAWLYYAFMESSAKQATFGKLALGLTVTDLAGERIGFWRATGRFFGRLISVLILLGGFIMAFFTQKRQTLHDMMAGCLVMDANVATQSATPPADYSAPASRPASTHSSAPTSTAPFVPASQSFGSATRAASSPSVTTQFFAVDEDAIYAAIANELESGATDKGLWTRLFAECDGDENRTKVGYIKQRAEKLISLEQIRLSEIQRLRDEESIRIEQTRLESVALSGLREQMAAGFYSDENQQKLKSLSASYTAEMFFGKVRNNLLNDVEFLLRDNPLLVAVSNSDGNTPLHVSILERYVEMSQLLLQMGAPTYIENKNGDTPLNLARKKGRKRLVELLTSSSA